MIEPLGSLDSNRALQTVHVAASESTEARRQTRATGGIVIGGSYRALATVRSLGRQGIPVTVLTDEHTLAGFSRYAQRRFPWPIGDPDRQLRLLDELATHYGHDDWTVFPTDDESAAFLARHHADLARQFRLTVPPWEALQWSYDKRLTYRLAADLGIDHPRTCSPGSRDALAALEVEFPLILKPAIKERVNAFTHAKAWRVDDRAELFRRYDEACRFVDPGLIMVQELIPKADDGQVSYAALCAGGRPLASIVARRTRQYPLDFGRSSTYVETIVQPEIVAPSHRLLAATRFTGLIEIEFKRDPRDGRFKLLDVNPRVWGWHSLGRAAGVDFPYLQWQAVHGEAVVETRARIGVRWVRGATDVQASLAALRRGNLSVKDYLRSLSGPIEFAVLAGDDPIPALVELPLLASVVVRRRIASRWRRAVVGGTAEQQHLGHYAR